MPLKTWAFDAVKILAPVALASYLTYRYTKYRERQSGAASRRRELLQFIVSLREEMAKTHIEDVGPMVQNSEVFHEEKPTLVALLEACRADIKGLDQLRFDNLAEAITSIGNKGFSKGGHERAVAAIDAMAEFLRAKN